MLKWAFGPKDPSSTMDYTIDWSEFLEDGDTISSSSWSVPTGLTASATTNTTTTTTIWLSGGTAGRCYEVRNRITTVNGLTDVDRSFHLPIKDL